jgi:hypothetical protein
MTGRARSRRAARATATVLLVAALVGCTAAPFDTDNPQTQEEGTVDFSERPSMEVVLDRYERMRTEAVARLDAELGPRPWTPDPTAPELSRSGCSSDVDPDGEGEGASPRLWILDGTYDPADWQRALDIVTAVGREHGFETTGTIVDQPGDVKIYGEDQYGGRYYFGMLKASIFSLDTGCHRWDVPPPSEF